MFKEWITSILCQTTAYPHIVCTVSPLMNKGFAFLKFNNQNKDYILYIRKIRKLHYIKRFKYAPNLIFHVSRVVGITKWKSKQRLQVSNTLQWSETFIFSRNSRNHGTGIFHTFSLFHRFPSPVISIRSSAAH